MIAATWRSGQVVLHRLQQPVADHPLGLGAEHVERVRRGQVRVGGALQRQHADLGAVAVGDDQLVLGGQRGQRVDRAATLRLLHVGVRLLAALQQRVAAERDDDAHLSRPGWRRGRP